MWRRVPALRRLRARRVLAALGASRDPTARLVGQAIVETWDRRLDSSERGWVERIEALRRELEADVTEIEYIDYGAGAPDSERTRQEASAGITRQVRIGEVCRTGSKPPLWCLLLFKLVRRLQPGVCLELGSCLGISAAYQAAALELNQRGKLISLEGSPALAERARRHLERLGLGRAGIVAGRFQDTLDSVLSSHRPVDYAFIDGHHDEQATGAYFAAITAATAQPALLVFDDIEWSAGMRRAWQRIAADPAVSLSIDLHQIGIGVSRGTALRRSFTLDLD